MRRVPRRCLVVLAPLLLGGCLQATKLPPAPPLPAQFAHALPASPTAPSRDDSVPWWQQLGNPALAALVERGLARGAGLEEARWRLVAARALGSAASSPFRPNLRLHTLSASNVESTASYLQAGFDSQWEFGLFGKAASEEHLVALGVDEAAIAVDAARLTLAAEVVRHVVDFDTTMEVRRLASDGLTAQQQLRDLLDARRRLGLASATEVEQADSAILKARAQLATAESEADAERSRVALLVTGDAAAPMPELTAAAIALAPPGAIPLPAQLLERRPDLRVAALAVRKAAAELDSARAERLPQIALVGELSYAAKIDGDELLKPRRITALGPAINIPLFDWGLRRARADARGAELAAASAAYRRVAEEAVGEAESALLALAATEREVALDGTLVERRRLVGETITRRRALGLADALDAAQADLDLIEARTAEVRALAARDLATLALLKCLGGPPPRNPS